jgi:tripartite-type tricarboxylate transporter receptor subunit TctC
MRTIATLICFLCSFLGTAGAASAQAWPTKSITIIVPYAAGGDVDAAARWIAPELAKRLGQPVIIDNVAGAGGTIGTERAARTAPDGYTVLLSVESTMIAAKLVSPQMVKYDGLRDFQPVTLLATSPLVLVGRPSLAPSTLDELLQVMRAQPDKLNYATSGVGTSLHITGEMIKQQGRVLMAHVPYKSASQIITELMGGMVDLAVLPIGMVTEQVKAGKIRAYGLTEQARSAVLPDVPSMAENPSLKGVDMTVWNGLFVPAGTDKAIVARIHREVTDVLKQPAVAERFANSGRKTVALGPDEFARFLAKEHNKLATIVRAGNIKAE